MLPGDVERPYPIGTPCTTLIRYVIKIVRSLDSIFLLFVCI